MKKFKLGSAVLSLILAISLASGCTPKPVDTTTKATKKAPVTETQTNSTSELTVTDQIGREVTLKKKAEKIASSYYISTAILVALGLEDNLCGIEAKADTRELYKRAAPNLLNLPEIGSGKGINIEETASLEPDVVIIPQKLKDSVESFEKLNIPVIVVDPETLENYNECVSILSKITGTEEKGEALLSYYNEKMDFVSKMTEDLSDKPSVYLSAGRDYLSTCTSKMYQNSLIETAGGINVSRELTDGYWQAISAEQLNLWSPEYIFAVSYAQYSLDDIKNNPALSEIPAVKDGKVFFFPSSIEAWDYPAPSSVLGVLYLTHMLHPDVYSEEQYVEEAKGFYKEFFDIEVTNEDLGL